MAKLFIETHELGVRKDVAGEGDRRRDGRIGREVLLLCHPRTARPGDR